MDEEEERPFHLENVHENSLSNPRTFIKPDDDEIKALRPGDIVRLFFVFDFETDDNCRAERMWVEIFDVEGDQFKGYLTNEPVYLSIRAGHVITFTKDNIAAIVVEPKFDESLKAIISRRALEETQVNWAVYDEPINEEDSGWQLFYGNEDPEYLDNPGNSTLILLKEVLSFEPRLEKVFESTHTAFEWDPETGNFIESE